MKNKLGIFGGTLLIAFGVFWFWLFFSELPKEGFNVGMLFLIVYGLLSIILGVYILFNLNNEDKIEQIKSIKGGKNE